MAIYMKYEGVPGQATTQNYKDWITLHSMQFGVGRGISTPTGSAANREASTASVSECVVSKVLDDSSLKMWEHSLTETKGKKVDIVVTSTSSGDENEIFRVELTNTLISGYSLSTGGDRPSESISLNFTKMFYKFVPQAEAGSDASGGASNTYNIATAKLG